MTKLGVQGGTEEDVKQDVAKDPKVFTVVQPTFVPIPIQSTEPMRKSVPSTWCLMARLLALVLIGSILVSALVYVVWNKDDVARAISGDKSIHFRTLSEPQFAALNSQAQKEVKKEEAKDDGAQITIKQTDDGTQMTIQLPKASEETKDGEKTNEGAAAIPILQLVPARSDESSDESNEMEQSRRPMHPYEMEGPSPDALNYGMHPLMALQAARAAQYENEMRAWRMRRLQQMLMLAAVQQAQQREAAMRYAFFQRQQWVAQQMAMQQAMEQRRQAEWQDYWRRQAFARAMQQQQAVASSWQTAEQPRPWWTQQQQPMMAWPQQQFMQQQQPQFIHPQQQQFFQQQQQQPMMHPFWMQQQQQQQQQPQPAFENQGPQVPQSQPLLLFQQALQARLRERMQQLQQHQEMQQQSSEEEQQQPQQPQPHAFIFIRRFFPIPQDSRENSQPAVSSEESNEHNIPLRPHDASAQQIVEQMRGGQQQPNALPEAPLPGIHDRIFQHFQTLSQQMQDRSGHSQSQSQPPLFASIPNSIEAQNDQQSSSQSSSQSQEQTHYDQDAIYEKLQRKAMQLQQDGSPTSVQASDSSSSSSSSSGSHSKEDSAIVGEDDHDIRRGDAVLGANDKTAQVASDIKTTTEPVMIENFVRAQSQEKDSESDELTAEEKRKVAQLDSAELKEAAALEASLEREAKEKEETERSQMAKVEEDIVHDANKDSSSSSSSEEKKDEKEEEEPTPSTTTLDPLSEFFSLRFFENEAVKLSSQDKSGERVVVDSETGTHHPTAVVDEVNDEENSSETKADEMPEELPAVDSSKDEEVSAAIDTAPVSNEADIKVSQVANSREIPSITAA